MPLMRCLLFDTGSKLIANYYVLYFQEPTGNMTGVFKRSFAGIPPDSFYSSQFTLRSENGSTST